METMKIVIAGHVDHGKSTIIGRLLADTDSLPEGKLEQVKQFCRNNSRPFEYAFLLDALKDEQAQGITIDSARVFFKSQKRKYIIFDAPGHIEFLKNMVTGASQAEAALLVIDSSEGIRENSRRHAYMMSLLGIKQIAVLVNKMDLVGWSEEVFSNIKSEFTEFLEGLGIKPKAFVPVSGLTGSGITGAIKNEYNQDETHVLDVLDSFETSSSSEELPFRMPVQDVYKFTAEGDNRRIIAGSIKSGCVKTGDTIVFYPSLKKSRLKNIESFPPVQNDRLSTGDHCGFTLEEQIFITRGEIAAIADESAPTVSAKLLVSLFWLSKNNLVTNKEYLMKVGTTKVPCRIEQFNKILNSSDLSIISDRKHLENHEVCECVISCKTPVAFDTDNRLPDTSRFVLIDDYEISGGGIIREAVSDEQQKIRDNVRLRESKWIHSNIAPTERSERYNQKPLLIMITGKSNTGRKTLARELEKKLFEKGKFVYYLGMGSVLYGVSSDLKERDSKSRQEIIRRFTEVANIMLDAGLILIVTALEFTLNEQRMIETIINNIDVKTIWTGDEISTDLKPDVHFSSNADLTARVTGILDTLGNEGYIFKSW